MLVGLNSCKKDLAESSSSEKLNDPIVVEDHGEFKNHIIKINGNKTYIKEENGQFFWSSDEILTKEQFDHLKSLHNKTNSNDRATVTKNLADLWTNGIVYIDTTQLFDPIQFPTKTLNKTHVDTAKRVIARALNDIENRTSIRFRNKSSETKNYVVFKLSTFSNSKLGMIGGKQYIQLASLEIGTVQHELMHALGVHHEQCRPDRDNYITVNVANISPESLNNWNISNSVVGLRGFDEQSIMLYDSFTGAINKNIPIMKLSNNRTLRLANAPQLTSTMSRGDVEGLNFLYQNENITPRIDPNQTITIISKFKKALTYNESSNAVSIENLNNRTNQNWVLVPVPGSNSGEHYIASANNRNSVLTIVNTKKTVVVSSGNILLDLLNSLLGILLPGIVQTAEVDNIEFVKQNISPALANQQKLIVKNSLNGNVEIYYRIKNYNVFLALDSNDNLGFSLTKSEDFRLLYHR